MEVAEILINQDANMEVAENPTNQDADIEAGAILANQDANMVADMEAEKIPRTEMTATILELEIDSTFLEGSMRRIMIPKFYDDLWEIAERLIDERTTDLHMLITEILSTGKSVMGSYFIYKLRKKLGLFDLVYEHERSKEQTFYSKDGSVTKASTFNNYFRKKLARKDTVYIVDGAGAL